MRAFTKTTTPTTTKENKMGKWKQKCTELEGQIKSIYEFFEEAVKCINPQTGQRSWVVARRNTKWTHDKATGKWICEFAVDFSDALSDKHDTEEVSE